ncbi:MAG TPA: winged helix-turn-helix domain-containing protein [Chloroflexota bacterium]|nr:winged helix-turn-helix domain-containing protein [Chloroflexota bacterium]
MANHLRLAEHFTSDELYRHYRAATDAVVRSHWQIIWLKSQGQTTPQITQATGYSGTWIRQIIHRYNEHGADGLADQRHRHPGAPTMLSQQQQRELEHLLETGKAPDGTPWTGPKIARWIEEKTGRAKVHDQRGWDYLVRLGFSAQTPRPRHQEADAAAQAAFKK